MENIEEYKKMYLFMYKEFVKNKNYLVMTLKEHDTKIKKSKHEFYSVPFKTYEFYRSSYSFYYQKMSNIIGDIQADAISYRSLIRNDYLKKFDLNIAEKPQEINEMINTFTTQRHLRSHFSLAEGRANVQYYSEIKNEKITIYTPEYYSSSMYSILYEEHEELLRCFKLLEEYILSDYYTLFNKNIEIEEKTYTQECIRTINVNNVSHHYSKIKKYSKAQRK